MRRHFLIHQVFDNRLTRIQSSNEVSALAEDQNKQQLSQREVELSKQLSRVRIHVERVIGLLKNKFLVLKGPLPISILKHKGDTNK